MAQLNTTSYKNLYGNSGSEFPDNTSAEISEGDMRTFGENTADSFLNKTDNFIDEDSFASDSATKVPSQQSVKAYVDAQIAGGGLQTATVTISSAEILALNGTPKQLIAAPGAGKIIVIHSIVVRYIFVSAAYATNTNLSINYDTEAADDLYFNAGLLANTADHYDVRVQGQIATSVDVRNKSIKASTDSGNPTTGDSTLKIVISYSILDFT